MDLSPLAPFCSSPLNEDFLSFFFKKWTLSFTKKKVTPPLDTIRKEEYLKLVFNPAWKGKLAVSTNYPASKYFQATQWDKHSEGLDSPQWFGWVEPPSPFRVCKCKKSPIWKHNLNFSRLPSLRPLLTHISCLPVPYYVVVLAVLSCNCANWVEQVDSFSFPLSLLWAS